MDMAGRMAALKAAVLLACLMGVLADISMPTTSAPGGLPVDRTPQFVLFTHDDAIIPSSYGMIHEVLNGRMANGCPLTITMFTQVENTECDLVQKLWNQGAEIADHTKTHPRLVNLNLTGVRDELLGARQELAACGIPPQSIVGARCPYLDTDPTIRMVLHNNGFLYDSSLIEQGVDMAQRKFPWDMQYGVDTANCAFYSNIQNCTANETYPGLWQVPIYDLTGLGGPYSMDPGADDAYPVYDILKTNFDAAYNGNRAPFPIYIHSPWMRRGTHLDDLKKFVDYARALPGVYFITIRQLIAWMKAPIGLALLTPEKLGCGNPGGAPATPQQLAPKPPSPSPSRLPTTVAAATSPAPVPVPVPVASPIPVVQGAQASPSLPVSTPLPVASQLQSSVGSNPVAPGIVGSPTLAAVPVTSTPSSPAGPPAMPTTGIRATMTLGGVTADTFNSVTAPQLLMVLRQLLAGTASAPVFIASVVTAPPSPGTRRLLRRALRQAAPGQALLQAVAVVGGSDPRQMYRTMDGALSDGTINTVLALSGAYLTAPSVIVPFKNSIDIPMLGTPSPPVTLVAQTPPVPVVAAAAAAMAAPGSTNPSPQPASRTSSSGSNMGVVLGAGIGCTVAVLLLAGLAAWLLWRRHQRRSVAAETGDVVAGQPQMQAKKYRQPAAVAHTNCDSSSQGTAEPHEQPPFAAHGDIEVCKNELFEEA